jgi:RNA polymerase sigma factor (sigma-70 family)
MSPKVSTRLLATQSDERLVRLVAAGHERAFEAIVGRYRRPLLAYCRRLGLAEGRAEDVIQQSFLHAWLSLQRGTQVRELRPWLYRIVHNMAVNAIRRAPAEVGGAAGVALLASPVAEAQLEHGIAARDALGEVAALPPMQREAIVLSALDGRSHQEVASVLGVSHGAVRGLLYRARATLRSAAAVLAPAPLLRWAGGTPSQMAPTAERLAALSGSGGGETGTALVKGLALTASAAIAAGAVLIPHHHAPRDVDRHAVAVDRGAPRAPARAEAGAPSEPAARAPLSVASVPAGAGTATGSRPAVAMAAPISSGGGAQHRRSAHRTVPQRSSEPVAASPAPAQSVSASPPAASATSARASDGGPTGTTPAPPAPEGTHTTEPPPTKGEEHEVPTGGNPGGGEHEREEHDDGGTDTTGTPPPEPPEPPGFSQSAR